MSTARQGGSNTRGTPGHERQPRLVHSGNFLVAVRDSGYRSTSYAIAELVDNAIQAEASEVQIRVSKTSSETHPIVLTVADNGIGMSKGTLALALSFGGSTRFDDRTSLGRYGMGLPTASLSCARQVDVVSWRGSVSQRAQMNLDDLMRSDSTALPPVTRTNAGWSRESGWRTGTVVQLSRCDRLAYQKVGWLVTRLESDLSRIFRTFIRKGLTITVNDRQLEPRDHLMLVRTDGLPGARSFGEPLVYALDGERGPGKVVVRFSELPVQAWVGIAPEARKRAGITNGTPVSVLRAGREIVSGWYFMGSKRRENYDDWWRCEIDFEPALDELFGLSHAKQSISPTESLTSTLSTDLESIARALNSRVRRSFELTKLADPLRKAELIAEKANVSLPQLRFQGQGSKRDEAPSHPYKLDLADLNSTMPYDLATDNGSIHLRINTGHPFFTDLYSPLANSDSPADREAATRVALSVLATARAEFASPNSSSGDPEGRRRWGDILATFLSRCA